MKERRKSSELSANSVPEALSGRSMNNLKTWHVIYTKARHERKIESLLNRDLFEAFCPVIHTRKQWSDRVKKITLPMFPSYVFVKVADNERDKILGYSGIVKFVYWLGRPAIVKEEEISKIRLLDGKVEGIELLSSDLAKGNHLQIREGMFKGMNASVDSLGKKKVILTIEELNLKVVMNLL